MKWRSHRFRAGGARPTWLALWFALSAVPAPAAELAVEIVDAAGRPHRPRFSKWAAGDWSFGEGPTRTAGIVVRPLPWFSLHANKVAATLQLNVRNVTEDGRLQAIKANPDGQPNVFRIIDPRQFILTATFDL